MDQRHSALILPAALVALVASSVACSSKSSPAGVPVEDANADADAGADSTPAITNACVSESDRTAVYAAYCPGPEGVPEITGDCAVSCVFAPDAGPDCVLDCLRAATDGAISPPCMDCHVALTTCARQVCLDKCISGPLDPKCLACMCGTNYPNDVDCYAAFNACSGLGLTYCGQLDAGTFDGFTPPTDAGPCDEAGSDAP